MSNDLQDGAVSLRVATQCLLRGAIRKNVKIRLWSVDTTQGAHRALKLLPTIKIRSCWKLLLQSFPCKLIERGIEADAKRGCSRK